MLKRWFYKLGSDPAKSWADFKIGLFVFCVGVVFILLGAKYWALLQVPGLLILAGGFVFAAKGYLGIFANRFSQTLSQLSDAGEKDRNSNHQD
ncbi:hypothetical protein [Aliiglaciecola sp. M165]|uniref:hypothetical protein n=1 Tax=Aliiglaciecola sp. M165 TaxID=2593649 RepID=UPI00117F491F|nr:hypothetical protein [Aliiglaciecola sp. M165]TRY33341.1 hypothetical protein FM019_05015 [Aliiglaciecola sp. M165]